MQLDKAKRLRGTWGDKPCIHPKLEKEYFLGADTMDFVCATCGKEFTRQEKEALETRRKDRDSK